MFLSLLWFAVPVGSASCCCQMWNSERGSDSSSLRYGGNLWEKSKLFFQLAVSTTSNLQEKSHAIGSSLLQKHSGGVENQRNLWGFHYQLSSSRDFRKNNLWPFAPPKKGVGDSLLRFALLEKVLAKMTKIYRLYQFGGENSDFHPMWSNPKKHHLT